MAHRPAAPATQSRGFSGPLPPSALRPPPSSAPLASGPGACIVTCFGPWSYPQRPVRPVPRHDTHCHSRRHGLYGPGTDQDPAPPSGGGDRRRHQPAGRPAADRHDPPLAHRPAGSAPGRPRAAEVAARAECVFSCLPHGASAAVIPQLLDAGARVVDFSADYRLNDAEVYRPVVRPEARRPRAAGQGRLRPAGAVPRSRSCPARLVANPGCYPTSAILAAGAAVEGRADRATATSSSIPRAASPARAGRPS